MEDFKQITIIGTGLIGGSLGLAFKEQFPEVRIKGVTRKKENLDKALEMGAIDEGTFSLPEAVSGSDLVFVATPVGSIVEIIKQIYPHLKEGAIITDVGSTKARIVHRVDIFLPNNLHFIGGHPMAGSEQQGVGAAHADLFKNAFYFLTPTNRTDNTAFKTLHSLLTKTGAQVLSIDPDKHDRLMAKISHLPHIVSAALVHLVDQHATEIENPLFLTGRSFQEMTRIAASAPELWLDVCIENDEAILEALDEFQQQLKGFAKLIRKKKREALSQKFEEAKITRLSLPSMFEKKVAQLFELSIPVADEPGAISEITLSIGRLGTNIEDIEIVPLTKTSGVLKLVLAEKKNASQAAKVLQEKGYEVKLKSYHK